MSRKYATIGDGLKSIIVPRKTVTTLTKMSAIVHVLTVPIHKGGEGGMPHMGWGGG
ncbi:MAG: hypothetical protein GWN18_12900 [Thermoplasmata archaeon]|nr:hypothetical protein [Thermoplasmata archaeon]NIS12956.1 hypothetical protein [Thermoplasmata archaeon]NIS20861.1 hypothetical protein [Thermoplasmata archaeon]NIT78282.1 hypothetical protein [Thermoplasmata archaeon]NIU49920.1 hypothetical protein [Thermoplasmata archaeon]